MSRYSRVAWQAVAIAAFGGTAVLAIVLTRTPPDSVAEIAACRAAAIRAWLDNGNHPAAAKPGAPRVSPLDITLEFTNVSRQTCSLYGYPHVWAYDGGHLIGRAAMFDTSVRPGIVTLAPRATAHAVLRYTVADDASCRPVTIGELRVYPPPGGPEGGGAVVPLRIPGCSGTGGLNVEPVQAPAGPVHDRY